MNERGTNFTRRTVVGALAAVGLLPVVGCKPQGSDQPKEAQSTAAQTTSAAPTVGEMTVYRDPSCGCCEAWAELAKDAGYQVSVIDHPDMPAVKKQFSVPDELSSCHTAIVAGYAIEGHVPFEHVSRLLEMKSAAIRGIAVAGMPRGSPGMEMPDWSKDPFEVMAFDKAGRLARFEA